jgi:hypothetical protein
LSDVPVLTTAEIVQAAKDAVSGAVSVSVATRQREIDFDVTVALALTAADRERGVTKRARGLIDEPSVKVAHGKTALTFARDPLDRGRWVATGSGGSRSLVDGAGDVVRAIEQAGLPLSTRSAQPARLTTGGTRPMDTTGGL